MYALPAELIAMSYNNICIGYYCMLIAKLGMGQYNIIWDRYDFKALLKLVKSFVLLVWDIRKNKLYGDQDGATPGCSCSCPLTGDLTSSACVCVCVVNGVSATAAT